MLVPESGDSIQTLKAGLMEIADLFVVNKADRPGADRLRNEIELMLGLRSGAAGRETCRRITASISRASARRARAAAVTRRGGQSARRTWTPPVLAHGAPERGEGIDDARDGARSALRLS